jgi:acyl phosphate:glycerol-3-phosphate acyltransferase
VVERGLGTALALLACYLLGSIPTGYLYGRARGIDIRRQGSGNLGATNVVRVLGWGPGVLVLLIDIAKGFLAVWVLARFSPFAGSDLMRVGCGLAAVLGHTFTVWLRFQGGKGVATSCGVFLALAPLATSVVLLAFVAVVAATRYVSLGSILAAALLPLLVWAVGEGGRSGLILLLAALLAVAVVFLHRSNIQRLLRGTENRLGAGTPEGEKR